jgi:hypothetical protein
MDRRLNLGLDAETEISHNVSNGLRAEPKVQNQMHSAEFCPN